MPPNTQDTKPATDSLSDAETKTLTAAEAAALVKRKITNTDGGATRTRTVPIAADEVLAWHDHGTHVVVVTKDGQKHSNAPASA